MTVGEGAGLRLVLFPTQVSEFASEVEAIFRVVHDRTGNEKLQPRWPAKGDVPD